MAWAALASAVGAHAQTETTLYDFTATIGRPATGFTFDSKGNLFAGSEANSSNEGTVFELSPGSRRRMECDNALHVSE